jgi:hypothetical protein
MVDVMYDLAMNSANDGVRQRAAADMLDRAGIKGAVEIDVTVRQEESAADRVHKRLETLASRVITDAAPARDESEDDVVDAELEEGEGE